MQKCTYNSLTFHILVCMKNGFLAITAEIFLVYSIITCFFKHKCYNTIHKTYSVYYDGAFVCEWNW